MAADERFVLVAAVVIEYERCVKASGEGERGVAHANFSKEQDRMPAWLCRVPDHRLTNLRASYARTRIYNENEGGVQHGN